VIRTPVQAPNANAYAERWVGSVRRECLDRLLILSRGQLEHVLRVHARHYNRHRPHRSFAFRPPDQADRVSAHLRAPPYPQPNRRDLLGASSTKTSTQPDKIDRTRRRRASSPPPLEHAYAHAWAVSRAREYRVCRIDVKCTPIHAPARAESVWEADSGNNPRQRPESN
jgi:Integrase core domain